jgi:hypothetical protein
MPDVDAAFTEREDRNGGRDQLTDVVEAAPSRCTQASPLSDGLNSSNDRGSCTVV